MTVRFCDRYIEKRSRTHDQMVQAARSGSRNIAEGSEASATSKKTELKLTNVARASLVELRRDYEDFLRHRDLTPWLPNHPALVRFKALRCKNVDQVRAWVKSERHGQTRTTTDKQGQGKTRPPAAKAAARSSKSAPPSSELVANAALSLINICCYLLQRQIESQANAFVKEGGFTERLYRVRSQHRNR